MALGLFFASILEKDLELKDGAQFAMVLFFGGLGLLTYFFIVRKNDENGDK